jgi:hypothetical protein
MAKITLTVNEKNNYVFPDSDIRMALASKSKKSNRSRDTYLSRAENSKSTFNLESKLNDAANSSKNLIKIDSKKAAAPKHGFAVTFNQSGKNVVINSNQNDDEYGLYNLKKNKKKMRIMESQRF